MSHTDASQDDAAQADAADPQDTGWLRATLDLAADRSDEAAALLWSLGASGVELQDAETFKDAADPLPPDLCRAVAFFGGDHPEHLQGRIAEAAQTWRLDPVRVRVLPFTDTSWKENWKRYFKPAVVSTRLAVGPPWEPPEVAPPQHAILIEPGLAFGTGTHATTRLCLQRLDDLLGDGPTPASMLDVGCGSGILSIAAALLRDDLAPIDALDVDPEAVRVTTENVAFNRVEGRVRLLTHGQLAQVPDTYDLVVANILSHILILLADDLIRCTRPDGGQLLLCGIGVKSEAEVHDAFQARGLTLTERHELDGWVALTWRKP